jgi:uncharacterized protein
LNYAAPWWLPGGDLQTIWPALYARRGFGPHAAYRRERWMTPDGDFLDVDWLEHPVRAEPFDPSTGSGRTDVPLLVLFHGLEGSSRSHYAQAFAEFAKERGVAYAVPHFRGCSGELNHAPRAYHSGDYEEIGWILERLRARHNGPMIAIGVSLGGNALMRWAAESGAEAGKFADAVAAVCSPIDLAAGSAAIARGFNRVVYTGMFLRSMKPKALAKLSQHPGLFDGERLMAARDLYEFDDIFTAPLHGFRDAREYYARASAKPHLHRIRIPALVLNALNDPFVPARSLPAQSEVGKHVTLWQPAEGGHVGFPDAWIKGHVRRMPDEVGGWLLRALGQ